MEILPVTHHKTLGEEGALVNKMTHALIAADDCYEQQLLLTVVGVAHQ